MARWREERAAPGPAAGLERYAAVYETAAGALAAERLAAVRSWLAMLAEAGADGETAAVFLEFAREDYEVWAGAGGQVA